MARYSALDGVDETLRKLSALSVAMRSGLRGVVRSATERAHARARSLVRVGRVNGGTTRDAIRMVFFDDGDTGAVFVAPARDPAGRWGGGLRPKNLPIWLEYGTRKQSEAPFLVPAGRESARFLETEAVRVVTNAVKAAE